MMFSSLPELPSEPQRPPGSVDRFSIWTPARVGRALRLYLEEGLTAEEVAWALGPGFTRAAVIGKIRRLGYLKRQVRKPVSAAPRAPRRCEPSRSAWRMPPQLPPKPLPPLREVGPTGAVSALAHLSAGACRWPIDDPGVGRMHLMLFCGGAAEGHAYCAAHRAIAYRAGK